MTHDQAEQRSMPWPLYQRAEDGYPVGADATMRQAYGPIPEATEFQHGTGGRAKPVEIHGWQWSNDFGRWSALVTFEDGWHGFTYPAPAVQLALVMPEASTAEQTTDVDAPAVRSSQDDLDRILSAGPQFDMELARRAHQWNSMTPERRAEQARAEYKGHIRGTYEALNGHVQTEEQQAVLIEEMTRYKAGYLARFHALLEAKSRTANPMVTGPARFPTTRNSRRMETERHRGDELLDWQERAFKAMQRAILEARSPEQVQEDEWQKIKRSIDRDMATVAEIDTGQGRFAGFNRTAFVTSITDKLRRMAEAGEGELVGRALAYIREQQANWRKPFITDRNSIWGVLEAVEERKAEAPAPKSVEELIAEREGVRAVRNHDLDRLQLVFDEIPPATVREQLKSTGWNWSPRQKAWQRRITPNAEYALTQFLDGQAMPREAEERGRS